MAIFQPFDNFFFEAFCHYPKEALAYPSWD